MKNPPINIKLVTRLAEFSALESHWNSLLGTARQQTIFLSWQWLHTWWQVFEAGSMRLQIVLFQSSDELVGIAPFYLQPGGVFSGQILRFIGTGEAEEDQVVSEYLDIFAAPDFEQPVVEALSAWLLENKHWRRIQFDDVLAGSLSATLCSVLESSSVGGRRCFQHKQTSGHRYFITLPETMDEYLARLSASRRKRFTRCAKALVKDGGDTAGQRLDNLADLPAYLPVLERLNTERWRDKGGRGVFESNRFKQFHQTLCALLVPKDQAGITLVKQAESPIAALYLLFSGSVCHYYQSGFRAEGANRYMPLFVGHMSEIKKCIERGLSTYDFMRGAAESYKHDYACESEPMYTLRAWRFKGDQQLHLISQRSRAAVAKWLRAGGLLKNRP